MNKNNSFHIIYTEDAMYISKRKYSSWREIQAEYNGYKASLGDWSFLQTLDFLEFEYPNRWENSSQSWDSLLEELDSAIKTDCIKT